jgi:hypothetical protein
MPSLPSLSINTITRCIVGCIAAAIAAFVGYIACLVIGWLLAWLLLIVGTVACGVAAYSYASTAGYDSVAARLGGFFGRITAKVAA